MECVNIASLPYEVRSKLAELDLELAEGDITEKGYVKKRTRLLEAHFNSKPDLPPSISDIQVDNTYINEQPDDPADLGDTEMGGCPSMRNDTIPEEVASDPHIHVLAPMHPVQPQPKMRKNRRYTRDESRYRSDIREEAVKEALAKIQEETRVSHALIPSRRDSRRLPSQNPPQPHAVLSSNSPPSLSENNAHFDSDSAEEDDSLVADERYTVHVPEVLSKPEVPPHGTSHFSHPPFAPQHSSLWQTVSPVTSRDDAYSMPPPDVIGQVHSLHLHHNPPLESLEAVAQPLIQPPQRGASQESDDVDEELESVLAGGAEEVPLPGVGIITQGLLHEEEEDELDGETTEDDGNVYDENELEVSPEADMTSTPCPGVENAAVRAVLDATGDRSTSESTSRTTPSLRSISGSTPALDDSGVSGRVSEKIQQLVNTLKRPKRRPLSEYFVDDNDVLIAVPTLDPSAPKPKGEVIEPAVADNLQIPSGLPKDFVSALYHFASIAGKTTFLTCLDVFAKPSLTVTFAKLQQRCLRIGYMLLNKLGHRGEESLKPRDRVALVFPNNDPISFVCAFYGCVLAGVVPLAIEVPLYTRDASSQSMGFLLSGVGIRVALTNDECYKALPRNANTGEVEKLAGWPQNLLWINVEHHQGGVKVPKDWKPSSGEQRAPEDPLYLEYTFGRDGSVRAVNVTRQAALEHSRALTVACHYCEGDTAVCVVDAKREVGLWHAVLTSLLNGMHVIFVPYTVLKSDPGSWLRMVSKYRATVGLVKSRDMHWSMLAEREQSMCLLHSLRMLLVADGANPWSLTTCDAFLTQFRSHGMRGDTICPQAGSSECLTVALRRPPTSSNIANNTPASRSNPALASRQTSNVNSTSPEHANTSSGPVVARSGGSRGVLSMYNLSFGVVRVDAENSITALTIQDSGTLLPAAVGVCVKAFGAPYLCRTDEVGEICIASQCTGSAYWGLAGLSNSTFRVSPLREDGSAAFPSLTFVRSGLLGFLGPSSGNGSLIFVCGSMDGLIVSACRRHNADDIVSTVLAVEPMKLIYRGRTCIFSIPLLKDERIVVVAELRPGFPAEVIYKWISRVLQAVDTIHQTAIYAVALVPHNTLPKTPLGGINVHETRRRFEHGSLRPCHALLSPHTAITNLPEARSWRLAAGAAGVEGPTGSGSTAAMVGPSAMLVGSLVQGARLAVAEGPPLNVPRTPHDSSRYQYLSDVLQWRAKNTPEERLYTQYNTKLQEACSLTCQQLHRRAERIGSMLLEKAKIGPGAHVLLLYQPGVELVSAVFGCLYAGCVPVPVKPPSLTATSNSSGVISENSSAVSASSQGSGSCQLVEVELELIRQISISSGAPVMLTQSQFVKLLKSKEVQRHFPWKSWPIVVDTEESHRKRLTTIYAGVHPEQETAYLDYSVSSSGLLYGSRYSHAAVYSACQAQKLQCELYTGREVVLALEPYSGLAFLLWCCAPVFCGHHALLLPTVDCVHTPHTWLQLLSHKRARDAFCSYSVLEQCTRQLSTEISTLKSRGVSLSDLRSLVVVAEERPRLHSLTSFCKLFATLCLHPGVVSTSFGCPVNAAIALRGASHPEATTVYVDKIALRNDRIKLVERGSPNSLGLMECGTLLPGVRVAIVHPETLGHLADCQLGEVCVYSAHTASGFCTVEQSYGTCTKLQCNNTTSGTSSSSSLGAGPSQRPRFTPPLNAASSGRPASARAFTSPTQSRWGSSSASCPGGVPPTPPLGCSTTGSGALHRDAQARFHIMLQSGDMHTPYTRTGYMGFVKRLEFGGETHDALFVVEEVDESLLLRGMRFYPVDLENTILRAHRAVAACAVFTWSGLLVVVVELIGGECEALDVVAQVTARVLEEHFLIVGVAVLVDPGTIPRNNAGKKQRLLLRDTFVSDRLDPIYVAYNM